MPPGRPLSQQQIRETLAAWTEHFGNISALARVLGIHRSSAHNRLSRLGLRDAGGGWLPASHYASAARVMAPSIKSARKSVEQIKEEARDQFERKRGAADSKNWMPFTFKEDLPVALVAFGDPHLDECNFPLLEHHVNLVSKTEGAYGLGMGDYTNNWSGRLAATIFPQQEMTRPESYQLAEWFFQAVPWLVLIKGNHDLWSDKFGTGDVLDYMERPPESVLVDWQAKFRCVFPGGAEFKIWAAHDFPGRGMYSKAFSASKRGLQTGGIADFFICGDKHCWEIISTEHEHTGNRYHAGRARGYKWFDPHAMHLGFGDDNHGSSLVLLMDPTQDAPRNTFIYEDVEEGLEALTYKRKKAKGRK